MIDPSKIKNPELQCFSLKYLSEMEVVLDKTLNELIGDRANKELAEEIQDGIMKNKMLMEKRKGSTTPEQYRTVVLNNIEQDTKLHEIYKKLNLPELQQFILGRIKIMKL